MDKKDKILIDRINEAKDRAVKKIEQQLQKLRDFNDALALITERLQREAEDDETKSKKK